MIGIGLLAGTFLFVSPIGDGGDEAGPAYRSPLHIALSPDGATAYVVNHTGGSVSILDVAARKVTGELPAGPFPAHACVSPDGKTLYVTSLHGAAVQVVDLAARRMLRSLPAGFEPYGAALSKDGRTLFVVNDVSETLSILKAADGTPVASIPVGRSPRYVAATPDGSRLVVANGLGRGVSIIDAARGKVVETRLLGKASILRQVILSADGRWAMVGHLVSHDETPALQMERGWIHSNGVSFLDLEKPGHYVTILLDRLLRGAAYPWGLALSPDGRTLYVSVAGAHEVARVDIPKALRLVAATPPEQVEALAENVEIASAGGMVRRWPAGGLGPRGLAVSKATGEILVANYFSDDVTLLNPETGAIAAVIPLGPAREMTLWRKGELAFNDARLCSQGWFSCAGCHQEDASIDALNWDLPNDGLGNAKNVKSLHDAHDTPPAMWEGVREDMDAAVQAGQRFLGAIPDPAVHRALMKYLGKPRRPPNPYRLGDSAAAMRGREVFFRARCHACHPPSRYSDLESHDLGLARETDLSTRFDTPSLRDVYRTAPYLHDGRAATLREIFTKHNPDDRHGRTSGLSPAEIDDLVEFLRRL